MICRSGMLKLQIRRALQSKTLPYAILALMALVTVCFVQSCLMFWGHDRGEIPSAATQWVGNGLRSNAQLISFLVSYLLFPLTSAIFSMCLFDDKRDRAAYMLAPRSSMRSYLCSGALCSFGMAFVATLFVLLISQALAFLAFPAGTSADAYYGALGQLVTSQDEFALLATQPLSSLLFGNRYLLNLAYCLYDAFYAGAMALAAYAASIYFKGNRMLLLGLPTVIFLAASAAMPQGYNFADHLLPGMNQVAPVAFMMTAPALISLVSALAVALSSSLKRDVLL